MRNVFGKTCAVGALTLSTVLIGGVGPSLAQTTGASTSQSPYVLPTVPVVETTSILSVGDLVSGGYRMVGIPDGLGAFDNHDGTFTLLMNHEIPNAFGTIRAHGSIGAFVSKWIIRKSDLLVIGGSDLMQQVYQWNATTQQSNTVSSTFAFNRFCSADLPKVSAFYNRATGLGTRERIYMHGEEGGATGYQLASVVTGPDAGKTYVLGKFNLTTNGSAASTPSPVLLNVTAASTALSTVTISTPAPTQLAVGARLLGRTVVSISGATVTLDGNANVTIVASTPTSFTLAGVGAPENALANPYRQNKTVVIENNDGGTGIMTNSVAVYVGTKQNTGSEADKAGLTNGTLKFVNVTGNAAEIVDSTNRTTNIINGTRFTLSATASTTFSRPEDGAWNPLNPNQFYFVTTDRLDTASDSLPSPQTGQTRLWRLTFDDIRNPDLGGKIDLLIDGRTVNGQKVNMFDNITVNKTTGQIVPLEDVGGAAHNGKVWLYDPATDKLVLIAKHDPARFGDVVGGVVTTATAPFTNDEETSGVIDVSSILGAGSYLLVDQAHYPINAANPRGFTNPNELYEGGQLLLMHIPGAPTVERVEVDERSFRRSHVDDVTVVLEGVVPSANIAPGAFTLTRASGGTFTTIVQSVSMRGDDTLVRLKFTGPGVGVDGCLPEGSYTLKADATKIKDTLEQALDTDKNGIAGGPVTRIAAFRIDNDHHDNDRHDKDKDDRERGGRDR